MHPSSTTLYALALLTVAALALGACADTNPGSSSPTGGSDPCLDSCSELITCPEFADACPGSVLLSLESTCEVACKDETQSSQIEAASVLGCNNAVPALIEVLELACTNTGNNNGTGGTTGGPTGGTTGNTTGGTTGNTTGGTTGNTTGGTTGNTTGGTTGPGLPCDDVVCPDGQACNPNTGQCELDNLCLGVTCPPGQICDIQNGQCLEFSCQPDGSEENNSSASPTPIAFQDSELTDLSICSRDEDWFSISVPAGQSALFSFFFQNSQGDLDVRAFQSDGFTTISRSETTNDVERVAIPATNTTETRLVRIVGLDAQQENAYTLQVSANPGAGACNIDTDCPANHTCPPNTRVCTEIPACRSDGDCAGSLRCDTNDGQCYSCVIDEHCPGAYCFQNQCNECRLNEHCGAGGSCNEGLCQFLFCEEDPYEPNNIFNDAEPISPGRFGGVALCDDDEDWYAINVPANTVVYMAAEFEYDQGDIDIELLNSAGTPVDSSRDFQDDEYLAVRGLSAGLYYVRVFFSQFQAAGSQAPYTLTVDFNPEGLCFNDGACPAGRECARNYFCANQTCTRNTQCDDIETPRCDSTTNTCQPCEDDSLEPNPANAPHNLTNLNPGERLNTCNGDDYYTFNAAAGQNITITVTHTYREGDIDIYLIDNQDRNITQGTTGNDEEIVNWTAEYSGVYYIWISAYQNVYNTYNLSVSVQ